MISADRAIVRWLNHLSQHEPLRGVAVMSAKYLAILPPLLLVGLFAWPLWRRDIPAATKGGLAGLGAGLALGANQVVGQFVERARPYSVLASVHAIGSRNGDSSFYSDHSTLAVGTALGVFLLSRRWGIAALVTATLVGVGRIAVGAHYPSDVIAAALAAGLAVRLLLLLHRPVEMVLIRLLNPAVATAKAPE